MILESKMKLFFKTTVATVALTMVTFVLAKANPPWTQQRGYQDFCAELKKDCAKASFCSYDEQRAGTTGMRCEIRAAGDKDTIHKFDKICEGRGLKHNAISANTHGGKLKKGEVASQCFVE